jgi:hypothetical protein
MGVTKAEARPAVARRRAATFIVYIKWEELASCTHKGMQRGHGQQETQQFQLEISIHELARVI